MTGRRAALVDAGLYGASALVAAGVWLFANIPIQRTWGRLAVGPYGAGALLATGLALFGRPSVPKARAWIALGVFVGVAILPMALEATWRAQTDPGLHAQSEAIVTEESARAIVDGRDPYDADFSNGALHARPLGTRTHFPYLPGMLLFGLPRALGGSSAATDARVAFAGVTFLVAGLAMFLGRRQGADRHLRAFQILLLVPTGALLMATGGDDLPVLALMLLALVLAQRRNAWGAGIALGLAAATKQTAWLLVPFLILALRDGEGRTARRRGAAAVAAVVVLVVLPFVLWQPAAFVEDVVKFPLGLGRQPTAAGTPTLGSWLVRTFSSARAPITAALVVAVLCFVAILLVRTARGTPADAARAAGLVFLFALVLAPAGRIGYVAYPINLLAWSWLTRSAPSSASDDGVGEPAILGDNAAESSMTAR